MTDLENYLAQDNRDDLVRQVRAKIDETGVKYIYYQYVSLTGRIMGKGAPAEHWEAMAAKGVQTWIGGLTNVLPDRTGSLIGFGPNTPELLAMPDPDTFCQLPWEKRTGRVYCTLFHMREDKTNPGGYMSGDSRGNLRRIHDRFRKDHNGLHMRHGCEPEMMWLKRNEDGTVTGGPTKPLAYHIDQFEALTDVYHRIIEYATAMGLDMIQGDHEDAWGQLELNFMFDDALRTADRLTTYRQLCARVAREFGLIACFMTKPFMKMAANGCHHNISLWRGGEDTVVPLGHDPLPGVDEVFTYRKGGTNEFIDAKKPGGWMPPELGRHAVGGILTHLPALTAIGASTVNSYRRLMDTGLWAPVFADWGFQNRTCGLRVSAPGRMEYRSVDSMVNPYLMAAALIAAMDDGIRNRIDPGEPEERNIYEAMEAGKQVKRLPRNLGLALDALAADEVVKSALPGDMYRLYEIYKRDEWDAFNATVSNWDIDRYLDCLPWRSGAHDDRTFQTVDRTVPRGRFPRGRKADRDGRGRAGSDALRATVPRRVPDRDRAGRMELAHRPRCRGPHAPDLQRVEGRPDHRRHLAADVGRARAIMMGWPGARIQIDNVLGKPAGAKSIAFHQDCSYLNWFTPLGMCSCWRALDDTTATGGTMELVRGSHKWGEFPIAKNFQAPTDYRVDLMEAAAKVGKTPEFVPVVVP